MHATRSVFRFPVPVSGPFLALLLVAACGGQAGAPEVKPPAKPEYVRKTVVTRHEPGARLSLAAGGGQATLRFERLTVQARLLAPVAGSRERIVHLAAAWGTNLPARHSYAVVGGETLNDVAVEPAGQGAALRSGDTSFRIGPEGMALEQSGRTAWEAGTDAFALEIGEEQVFENGKYLRTTKAVTNLVLRARRLGRIFGLGGKTGGLELTGRAFRFWNSDTYKYTDRTDPIYSSFPVFLSLGEKSSSLVFFESMGRGGAAFTNDRLTLSVEDTRLDTYLFPGPPDRTLAGYSALTGRAELPPAWALGFHQCRYSYNSRKEVESVVSNFTHHRMPLDVIWLDIGFMDRNRSFTWDEKRFPDPAGMHRALAARGVRTVAIGNPGIAIDPKYDIYASGKTADAFCYRAGKPYTGTVWPGTCVFTDYTKPAARRWWGGLYRVLLDIGVAGFWNDMNEPSVFQSPGGTMPDDVAHDYEGHKALHREVHNVYGMQMVRATWEGLKQLAPQKRPFVLSRAGYPGTQRYAFLWTGDNSSDWSHLRMNLSMVLGLGLSGVPFSGADIGGYTGSPDDELFTRWMQLGAFMPFMRDHTEKDTKPQEPYVFPSRDTIRAALELRYKMLPFIYTLAREAAETSLPLVRPLFLHYGAAWADVQDQFLLGDAILVAPVLEAKADGRRVALPAGWWYPIRGEEPPLILATPETNRIPVTLADIPAWVRGGTVLPIAAHTLTNVDDFSRRRDLVLKVFPDANGQASGRLYEDALDGYGYRKDEYLLTTIEYRYTGDGTAAVVIKRAGRYAPNRKLTILLPGGVTRLTVNGKAVAVRERTAEL